MNRKTLLIAIVAGTFSLLATPTFAQNDSTGIMSREEINANKREAEEAVRQREDRTKARSRDDNSTLENLETVRKDNDAKAREARRASHDATDAAKQARRAANAERSAQKARTRADKQAGRADKATEKSERNR
jgi:Na+-translocating ferredoxin:NAD+ oxidoreductase RnfC subunit